MLLFLNTYALGSPVFWQKLSPGLEYSKVNALPGLRKNLHAFRIDLKYYRLELAFTNPQNFQSLIGLMKQNDAIIGVNGGFFSPDLKPLGLRITQGRLKSPLKYTPWWGIFFTEGSNAYVVSQKQFKADKNIDFAVQSGPRLIVNGQIPSLKPGVANRTALGIDKTGKVILLVTDSYPVTTQELANIMKNSADQGGLGCVNALNLDGGSSTQLYAKTNNFNLSIPSFVTVADAVLVVPRK
jgi:uncharacterized protein YigE (DUF2233 family)